MNRRRRFPAGIASFSPRRLACGLLLAALAGVAAPAGATERSVTVEKDGHHFSVTLPDTVVLRYRATGAAETAPQDADCLRGGVRGGVDCKVTKPLGQTQGSQGGAEATGATLTIPLTPKLGDDAQELTLGVGAPVFRASGLDRDTEQRLRREAAMVRGRLANWRRRLTRDEVTRLRRARRLQTAIERPFAGLALFTAPEVKASWIFSPYVGPPDLRFVIHKVDGAYERIASIPRGQPFYVEAEYRDPPDDDVRGALLTWRQCPSSIQVPLQRTESDRKLFRSAALRWGDGPDLGPENGPLSETSGYGWMYGQWNVEYLDARLGMVKGRATVAPLNRDGGLKSVNIELKHPATNTTYRLRARTLEEIGDTIVFRFNGRSPPSGPARGSRGGDDSRETAEPIAIPYGVRSARAELDGSEASTAVVEPELRLDLKSERPGGGDPTDKTFGWWRYTAPRARIRYRRAGTYEALVGDKLGEVRGAETWTRAPLTIESISTISFTHRPTFNGQPILGIAWIQFKGTNLPVQRGRRVTIGFADNKLVYTGTYSADPDDPTRLNAEVAVEAGVGESPKRVTLNDVDGTWALGLPLAKPKLRFVRSIRAAKIGRIREIYLGEVFYVEAVYDEEPLSGAQTVMVGSDGGTPIEVRLAKLPDDPRILRSEPILLQDPSAAPLSRVDFTSSGYRSRPSDFPDGIDNVIRAPAGVKIGAIGRNRGTGAERPPRVVALTAEPPPRKWRDAIKRARACYRRFPDRFTISNYVGFAETLIAAKDSLNSVLRGKGLDDTPFEQSRGTRALVVRPEALAAAFILRDEVTRLLGAYRRKLAANRPTASMLASIYAAGRQNPLFGPMFLQKVKRGLAVSEGSMSRGVDINLIDAIRGDRYFAVTDARGNEIYKRDAYRRFVDQSIDEAWRKTRANVATTEQTARATADCDVEGMIKMVGWGIKPVVRSVLPTLVRPPTANEPRQPRVLPDETARRWVGSLEVLGQALHAQASYAEADTDVILLVATVTTLGTGSISTAATVGMDVLSIGDAWHRYLAALSEESLAEGLIPVGGEERFRSAKAEADARLFAALANTAIGVVSSGTTLYSALAAKGIAPTREAMEWSMYKASKITKDDPALTSLTKADRKVIEFAEGRALEKQRLSRALDDTDRRALALKRQREAAGQPTGPPAGQTSGTEIASAGGAGQTGEAPATQGGRPPADGGPPTGGRSGAASPAEPTGQLADGAPSSAGSLDIPETPGQTEKFPEPDFRTAKATDLPPRAPGTEKLPEPDFGTLKPTELPPRPLEVESLPFPGSSEVKSADLPPGYSASDNRVSGNLGIGGPRLGLEVLPAGRLDFPSIGAGWDIIGGTRLRDIRFQSPVGELRINPELFKRGGFVDVHDLVFVKPDSAGNWVSSGYVIKLLSENHGRYAYDIRTFRDAVDKIVKHADNLDSLSLHTFAKNERKKLSSLYKEKPDSYSQEEALVTFLETQHGAGLLSTNHINQIEIQTWGSMPGRDDIMFIVQRKLNHHLPPGIDEEMILKDVMDSGRGSRDVQNVVLDLIQEMYKKNLGWEDLHWKNVVVQFHDNKPVRAAVIDHDRIGSFAQGANPNDTPVFTYYKEQMALSPASQKISSMAIPDADRRLNDAKKFMTKSLERKGYIEYSEADGFTSERFSIKVVCEHPGFRDLDKYLPLGANPGKACEDAHAAATLNSCPAPNEPPQPGQQGLLLPTDVGLAERRFPAAGANVVDFAVPAGGRGRRGMRRKMGAISVRRTVRRAA